MVSWRDEVATIVRPFWEKKELHPKSYNARVTTPLMDNVLTNLKESQGSVSPILVMAQQAMKDMDEQIRNIRAARSNINRLVQTSPSDKPTFLLLTSQRCEAEMRYAKTELNLWIQRHFRGGNKWVEKEREIVPDEDQFEDADVRLNPGHDHVAHVEKDGMKDWCPHPTCAHFAFQPRGDDGQPVLSVGHQEKIEHVDGKQIWSCTKDECEHFVRMNEEEFGEDVGAHESARHAQNQALYPGQEQQRDCDLSKFEGNLDEVILWSADDVYHTARDECSNDPAVRAFARLDGVCYSREASVDMHEAMVEAYRQVEREANYITGVNFGTAYPNV